MIIELSRRARWLDEWLQSRLGRPYNVVLGVGLVVEIAEQLGRLPQRLESAPNLMRTLLILLVELALLLHQVGALSHHVERRRGAHAKPAADAGDP